MKFKDLKPGERFIFGSAVMDKFLDERYGILTYTKLQKAVHCQKSIIQMSEHVNKKSEMKRVLEILRDNVNLKAYTATSKGGELIWVSDEANVLKLCS